MKQRSPLEEFLATVRANLENEYTMSLFMTKEQREEFIDDCVWEVEKGAKQFWKYLQKHGIRTEEK